MKRRPTEASPGGGLPPELAGGPDSRVWALDVVLPYWMDDPAGRLVCSESAAWRAWHDAGQKWATDHGLRSDGCYGCYPTMWATP